MGDGNLTVSEAARMGGVATLARHGPDHFRGIGFRGARALHATYRPLLGLTNARVHAGLTQNELARRAGLVNGSHVGRIERGVGMGAPKTVARLAQALGVEEAALMDGSETAPPS